jgi:hypothetical protein
MDLRQPCGDIPDRVKGACIVVHTYIHTYIVVEWIMEEE